MKRWIIAIVLSALLALSSSVYAAAPNSEKRASNNSAVALERASEQAKDVLKEVLPIDEEEDESADEVGVMSTQGAIWPKGIW